MILSLTPNAALDRVIFIDRFRPGGTMRSTRVVDAVGGKALDASVAIRAFAVDTLALSLVGGHVGRRLAGLLDGYGVRHDLVWLDGETRLAHVLVETGHHRHSHVMTGAVEVTPEAAAGLLARCETHLPAAAWMVTGGTLPPGLPVSFYRTLAELAHAAGKPILIDGQGPAILEALPAGPDVLKMNWDEFNHTFDRSTGTLAELIEAAEQVYRTEKLPALLLTCGELGLVALTPAGLFQALAPRQEAVNAAGAGDAASGFLAWRLSLGDPWPAALAWTAAASAAAVLTEATAEVRRPDVERLLPQTEVSRLS